MAEVYLAHDAKLDRLVALKLLREFDHDELLKRFERERRHELQALQQREEERREREQRISAVLAAARAAIRDERFDEAAALIDQAPKDEAHASAVEALRRAASSGSERLRLARDAVARARALATDLGRPDEIQLCLRCSGPEQVVSVARGKPDVEPGSHCANRLAIQRVLPSQDDVAETGRAGAASNGVRSVAAAVEAVKRRNGLRGGPHDCRRGRRIDVDAHDWDREPDVEVVGHPVGAEERHTVGVDLQPQGSLHEITLEERLEIARTVGIGGALCRAAAVVVLQIEPHVARPEVDALERVVGDMLIRQPEVELTLADGEGTLGKQRPER
jgi:hypothetical protein